jgi:hypothetical protein
MRTPRRLTTAAAAVIAAGAVSSPALAAASAGQRHDLRMPDTLDIAQGRVPAVPQFASLTVAQRRDLRMPDTRDVAQGRWPTEAVRPVLVRVQPATGTGLSWDSALIGAIAGAGILVSAGGGLLLVARRHPRTH